MLDATNDQWAKVKDGRAMCKTGAMERCLGGRRFTISAAQLLILPPALVIRYGNFFAVFSIQASGHEVPFMLGVPGIGDPEGVGFFKVNGNG